MKTMTKAICLGVILTVIPSVANAKIRVHHVYPSRHYAGTVYVYR